MENNFFSIFLLLPFFARMASQFRNFYSFAAIFVRINARGKFMRLIFFYILINSNIPSIIFNLFALTLSLHFKYSESIIALHKEV